MSIHKLTAGSGYDYLTRQVAALDATEKGHTGLASYYTERGESPGVWVGSGMAGIDGLAAGDVVTAEQMADLFGAGMHPLTTQRQRELDQRYGRSPQRTGVPSPTRADYQAASALGNPFPIYSGQDVSAFRVEVARRLAGLNEAAGLPADWAVPADQRARVRTEVAREFFTAEHGREPADAREIAATIARHSRPKTTAVAGYDLTFSPVKSVSTLWAVADQSTAAAIERAHQAAISDALDFLEREALYTRLGAQGARQVDVRGLVATAFTHRDSRAGDPDLHTHVAVANKVQTLDGRWRAVDGRVLFKAAVAASETYNTALEQHLTAVLGVRFAERPNPDARKRPVREILGVNPALNEQFSKRRLSVEQRRNELAADFQATHGRPPTPVETLQLSQQATLETREAKHEPRTLAEQRTAWHREAASVLGSPAGVEQMVRDTLAHNQALAHSQARARPVHPPDPGPSAWLPGAADRVVATMESGRASWQYWHVYAEAQRQVRTTLDTVPPERVRELADQLTREVLQGRSISLSRAHSPAGRLDQAAGIDPDPAPVADPDADPDADRGVVEPVELRRSDGSSVYTVAGAEMFTSTRVLAAEERLVVAAGRADGHAVDPSCVDLALLESAANGVTLNAGQTTLVRQMATSGARLQLAIAPAGAGKTTAMRALTGAWVEGGGTVVGLAPSAAAAAALRDSISDTSSVTGSVTGNAIAGPHGGAGTAQDRVRTDTLAKLTWSLDHARSTSQHCSGVGGGHRRLHAGGHRRGRDGRHPLPGPDGGLRPLPRRQRPPDRG